MWKAFLTSELILVVAIAAGVGVGIRSAGRGARRRAADQGDDHDSGRLTDAIAFVGGAFGILLGLLLVFAVQHYSAAMEASRNEAAAALALFEAAQPYPAAQRDGLRHDVVCFMRSVTDGDWRAAAARDMTGSENTSKWSNRVTSDIVNLTQASEAQASFHYFVTDEGLSLAKDRQTRLLLAEPDIPAVVWFVIYICAFVFSGLLTYHLSGRGRTEYLAIGSTSLVLVAIVGTLTLLDLPFSGIRATVRPIAMNSAMKLMQDAYPGPVWRPCEVLATDQAD